MNSDSLNMVSRLGEGHMPCNFFLSEPQLKTTVIMLCISQRPLYQFIQVQPWTMIIAGHSHGYIPGYYEIASSNTLTMVYKNFWLVLNSKSAVRLILPYVDRALWHAFLSEHSFSCAVNNYSHFIDTLQSKTLFFFSTATSFKI